MADERPSLQRFIDPLLLLLGVLNLLAAMSLRIIGSVMYSFFILVYFWIALYAGLIALLLYRWRTTNRPLLQGWTGAVVVVALTLVLRLVMLGETTLISSDPLWYLDFGKFMKSGLLPYTGFYFPYPPLFAYFILGVTYTVATVDAFRVLAAVLDSMVAIVLWKLAERNDGRGAGSFVALAYAFLPVSIIESGWSGHFEPLVNLFMLLSLWFMFERRPRLSGIMLGLAAATKVYPLICFPVMLFYFRTWRERAEFTLSAMVTGAMTFVPFVIHSLSTLKSSGTSFQGVSTDPVVALVISLFSFSQQTTLATVFSITGIVAATLVVTRFLLRQRLYQYHSSFQLVSIALGLVLVALGLLAALYPISPLAKLVYWRYPPDVGFVRGLSATMIGLSVIVMAYRDRRAGRSAAYSIECLLLLVMGTMLLFVALARDVFYGWYLLWSIPFFLLLRNRRVGLVVVLCLLLVYPSYTHDNFVSLGFPEERSWSDDFESVDGWSLFINTSDTGIDPSSILADLSTDGKMGCLSFNTTSVVNVTQLSNVTIELTKHLNVSFDYFTEFVARIGASWDPTFGAEAHLEIDYVGINSTGSPISGSLVPITGMFTNFTYVLWRYALGYWQTDQEGGVVHEIVFRAHPRKAVVAEYYVDFMYTTKSGLLSPYYFVVVPALTAASVFAYAVLLEELRHHDLRPPRGQTVGRSDEERISSEHEPDMQSEPSAET